jgi:chromosome segregation ATPase
MALQRAVWDWIHEILTSPTFVMDHLKHLEQRLRAEQPESAQRVASIEKRRDEIKAALSKYFARFESSADSAQEEVLLDRVRELKAELKVVEADITDLRSKVFPLPRRVSEEQVRRYLEKLRARVDTRPEYQRVLFNEFKRSHEFAVKVVSKTEFVLSLALPANDLAAEEPQREAVGDRRLMTVLAAAAAPRGSEVTGLPAPGGPMKMRL